MNTIEVDLLDSASIDAAIKKLNKHLKERERKIDLYMQKLTQVGEVAAQRAYGHSVEVKSHKDSNGVWEIRADGEQVIFLEFGAGVYTEDHGLTIGSDLNILIYPGGWSETEGKHMWSEWIAAGKDPYKFPWNQRPRAGMLEAYKAIVAAQDRVAREVFG